MYRVKKTSPNYFSWAEAVSKIDINNIPNRKNEDKLIREVLSYDFEAELNWLRWSEMLTFIDSPFLAIIVVK